MACFQATNSASRSSDLRLNPKITRAVYAQIVLTFTHDHIPAIVSSLIFSAPTRIANLMISPPHTSRNFIKRRPFKFATDSLSEWLRDRSSDTARFPLSTYASDGPLWIVSECAAEINELAKKRIAIARAQLIVYIEVNPG